MKKAASSSALWPAETVAEPLLEKLRAIADFLLANRAELPASPGLSGGRLGAFLFLHTYATLTENETYAAGAAEILLTAIKVLPSYPVTSPLYYRELAEAGTVISYLREQHYLDESFELVLEKIDHLLLPGIALLTKQELFDPFMGYLPAATYLLGRRTAGAEQAVQQVLDTLLRTYEEEAQGGFWRSYLFGKNQVYTGWSHGIAAVLLFLAKVLQAGGTYRLTELQAAMRGASRYLLAHQTTNGLNLFPDVVGQPGPSNTLNLCYGDLGIGFALLQTSQALAEETLHTAALAVLTSAAYRRGAPECRVPDASLIYGASGNSLFFKQLYQTMQRPAFQEAAAYWHQQAHRLSQQPGCVAGYKGHYNQQTASAHYSLFEGAAGYGLALLEYETDSSVLLSLIGY